MKKVWVVIAVIVISAALVLSTGGCAQTDSIKNGGKSN